MEQAESCIQLLPMLHRALMDEKQLIEGCIRNDRLCQEALFKRYAGKMKAVCMRYMRQSDEAEDVLQEGFIKLFKSLHQYTFQGSFEGWIRRIMVNTALTKMNKMSFKLEVDLIENYHDTFDYRDIVESISVKEIRGMIAELPEGYRVVFNLYVVEGYSHKEIAETLGITENTSRSQLLKARLALQNKLKKTEIDIAHAS